MVHSMGSHRILDFVDETGEPRRGSVRRRVMLTAKLETSAGLYDVRLRDVSAGGARVEADDLPIEGTIVVLRRGTFEAYGVLVWTEGRTGGIEFDEPFDELALMDSLRGVQMRSAEEPIFKRPGFTREDQRRFSTGQGWIDAPRGRS